MGDNLMKEIEIKKLAKKYIKKWGKRLGFSEWKIGAEITIFKRADHFPQDGDIIIDYPKKKATVLIGVNLKAPIEEVVVHELVHLMLWPLDQNAMSVIKVAKWANRKRTEKKFLGKLEKVVDRITRSFLQAQK